MRRPSRAVPALVLLTAALHAAPVAAQCAPAGVRNEAIIGGGVAGQSLGPGVDAHLVYEKRRGRPDSARLVAALVTRGQEYWSNYAAAERPRVHALYDSATAAARACNRMAGGAFGPRGSAWVEYDPAAGTIYARGQPFRRAAGDSALVVFVDRVDGVGGPPVVAWSSVPVRWRPMPDLEAAFRAAGADTAAALAAAGRRTEVMLDAWAREVLADPRVRAAAAPGGPPR